MKREMYHTPQVEAIVAKIPSSRMDVFKRTDDRKFAVPPAGGGRGENGDCSSLASLTA